MAGSVAPPSVLVPVGVLKRQGAEEAGAGAEANKSVMFSDGIRPGGDLTDLDGRSAKAKYGQKRAKML